MKQLSRVLSIALVLLKGSGRTKATFVYNVLYPMIYFLLFFVVYGSEAPPTRLFVGLVTAVVVAGGLYSLSIQLVFMREIGMLRTFYGAPIRAWHMLLGQMLNVFVIIMCVLLVQGVLAVVYFGLALPAEPLLALGEVSLAIFLMSAIGVLVSCMVGSIQASQTITRILFYLMLGVSGAVFPLRIANPWLGFLVQWSPSRVIYRALDGSFGTTVDAMAELRLAATMLVMAGTCFVVAAWLFKWDRAQPFRAGFGGMQGARGAMPASAERSGA
ncbi:MAG TPA: ABC transporter permease [Luteimonas sp.]|jgi:ABC-2 type transport system permease protein|nr:ABC transporter permease [Luteimonas sp.]